MQKSLVKEKLRRGEPTMAFGIRFLDPNLVEMLGFLGFDAVWICNEYKGINPLAMEHLVRAARAAGMEALVRTGVGSRDDIVRFLSVGANALMVPHVRSADDAREIVRRAKYPPLGHRELETVNADANFGLMGLTDYLKAANDESLLVVQLEDAAAIDRADEIAAVPGIDVLFVGPADLSLSLGMPGEPDHPQVVDLIGRVVRACEANGVFCGTPALRPEHCRRLMDLGVRYFTHGSDWSLLLKGMRGAKDAFGELGFTFREERGGR
ncbi:MAG TPA: aldolase/citrate lyase family protein [Thermoguttaceae bacterium]|nr:aldolase/citrate lyase family protein [Thermoguttaceae bacterium]